jgi:hypothetical protein
LEDGQALFKAPACAGEVALGNRHIADPL